MIPVPGGVRVWLATGVTDMRRGMHTLSLQVQEGLGHDPNAGDLYVFRGRRGDLIKILWNDGIGISLGSVSEVYAWAADCCGEAGPRRCPPDHADEMEPSQIAVQVLRGDAAIAAQETLQLAVAAIDRLNVEGIPDPLSGRKVQGFVANAHGRSAGRIAAMTEPSGAPPRISSNTPAVSPGCLPSCRTGNGTSFSPVRRAAVTKSVN